MPTPWSLPRTVIQFPEAFEHVAWDSSGEFYYLKNNDGQFTKALEPLRHRANLRIGPIKNKTWYLVVTNFPLLMASQYTNKKIIGIQVQIKADRGGRIVDDTVQLRYQNNWIGENRAQFTVAPRFVYGFAGAWDLNYSDTNLINAIVQDPSFGVGIRFQSHPAWPHSTTPMIDYVSIRVLFEGDENITSDDDPRELKEEGGGGDGDKEGGEGVSSDTGGIGFTGSQFQFAGSVGFIGSGGFTGSIAQFTGSTAVITFINGVPAIVGGFGPANTIQTVSQLPSNPSTLGLAFFVLSEATVYYWTGTSWASIR